MKYDYQAPPADAAYRTLEYKEHRIYIAACDNQGHVLEISLNPEGAIGLSKMKEVILDSWHDAIDNQLDDFQNKLGERVKK